MHRRHFLALLPASACASALSAQVRDLNDAVNKAGRQRMLSQRIAKAYFAIGQSVRPELATRVLADSMALFELQLAELRAFAPSALVSATYQDLSGAWIEYQQMLMKTAPSKANGDAVLTHAERVLQLAHQGTGQLEAVSGKPAARLVNIAGRQRMLSQRMAKMYLGASWGVRAAFCANALTKACDEFRVAHTELVNAPETSATIAGQLVLAEQQYSFIDKALRNMTTGQVNPIESANVFTTSERILQVMDGVTGQYARLAA